MNNKPGSKQALKSEVTRLALMNAVLECIRELGFAKSSSTEIARKAGLTRGAQLHHYENKHQLMLAAIDHFFSKVEQRFQVIAKRLTQPDYEIKHFISDLWHELFAPDFYDIMLEFLIASRTQSAIHEKLEAKWRHLGRTYDESWYRVLKQQGIFSEKMETTLNMTLFLLRGMAFERVFRGEASQANSKIILLWSDLVEELVTDNATDIEQKAG